MQAASTAAPTVSRLTRGDWLALGSLLALALAVRLLYLGLVTPMPVVSTPGLRRRGARLIGTGSYAYPVVTAQGGGDLPRGRMGGLRRMPPNAFSMPGYAWFVAGITGCAAQAGTVRARPRGAGPPRPDDAGAELRHR